MNISKLNIRVAFAKRRNNNSYEVCKFRTQDFSEFTGYLCPKLQHPTITKKQLERCKIVSFRKWSDGASNMMR